MDLRNLGSRDERRRRVLIDDAQAEPAHVDETPPVRRSTKTGGASQGGRYSLESLDGGQLRIADLLPRRRLTLWLWLLAAMLAISGLIALDAASAGWSAQRPEVNWSALRLDAPGSLASWLAALTLAWAGFAGLQIYLIRRHRSDDYRGGYRLWSSAALLLALASADAVTSLHSFFGQLLAALVGAAGYDFWIGIGLVAVAGGGFMARMVWEIKSSRGAVATLAVATLCYLATILSEAGLMDSISIRPSLIAAAAALCGHALVLLTVGVFGRYVFLEAHGLLPQPVRKAKGPESEGASPKRRPAKPKATTGAEEPGGESKKRGKSDVEGIPAPSDKRQPEPVKKAPEPKPEPKPAPKPAPAASSPSPIAGKTPAAAREDDVEEDEAPRLSKAERRRLRKQQVGRKAA